jgi:GntR family transcriptional regulator
MSGTLDRGSPVTLYQQLAEELRQDILEGRLPPGVAFPSERKLMARYQVTRSTVRSAIGMLRQEGLVAAEHGAGSFVKDPKAGRRRLDSRKVGMDRPGPMSHGSRRTEDDQERRFDIGALQGLSVSRMAAPPWISELFQVAAGKEILMQEGTGIDDQGAPALTRAWLHPKVAAELKITKKRLERRWLPQLLWELGVPGHEGEDVVEAAMPTPTLKHLMALPDGVPVLQLCRVMREQEQVVAVIETHLPADKATLVFPRVSLSL